MRSSCSIILAALLLSACKDVSTEVNATVKTADITTQRAYPVTEEFAGMPPERFRKPRRMIVSVGTLSYCGTPSKPGNKFAACVRDEFIVHLANPCDFPTESYAVRMCHEMAHLNKWPKNHGP